MTPYDAFQLYLGLKLHFTSNYDFVKYKGKTKFNQKTFKNRNDRYYFSTLAKHDDLFNFLISNFIVDSGKWVRDLLSKDAEDNYTKWLKYNQSLTYNFKLEIKQFDDINTMLKVVDGDYPPLLVAYNQGDVSIDTVIIMDNILNFLGRWKKQISDAFIFPETYKKLRKYQVLTSFDNDKFKSILRKHFDEGEE